MKILKTLLIASLILILLLSSSCRIENDRNKSSRELDITNATILLSTDIEDDFSKTLIQVLDEEIADRSSIKWENKDSWIQNQPVVALAISGEKSIKSVEIPYRSGSEFPENISDQPVYYSTDN